MSGVSSQQRKRLIMVTLLVFKLFCLLSKTPFIKTTKYSLPYESIEVGDRGCLYAPPSEVKTDMEREGLFEKSGNLINK